MALTEKLTSIANAIREKRGISTAMTLDQMATEIGNIQTDTIPNAYTKLEYIESSGTQYIDSGVMPTENCMAEIDFELTGYTNNNYMALVSASTHMYLVHFSHESGSDIIFAPNWFSYASQNAYRCINMNRRYRAICAITNKGDHNAAKAGGQCITMTGEYAQKYTSVQTYTPTNNFFIFARNNGGAVSYQTRAKLYSLKIYTDGVLRRDFVPAMRKTDNIIGLYDRVSDAFFTNIGTGTFTGGTLT